MFIRFGNVIINLATGERWTYVPDGERIREHIKFEYPNMSPTYIRHDEAGFTEFFEKVFTVDSGKLFYAQDVLTMIKPLVEIESDDEYDN